MQSSGISIIIIMIFYEDCYTVHWLSLGCYINSYSVLFSIFTHIYIYAKLKLWPIQKLVVLKIATTSFFFCTQTLYTMKKEVDLLFLWRFSPFLIQKSTRDFLIFYKILGSWLCDATQNVHVCKIGAYIHNTHTWYELVLYKYVKLIIFKCILSNNLLYSWGSKMNEGRQTLLVFSCCLFILTFWLWCLNMFRNYQNTFQQLNRVKGKKKSYVLPCIVIFMHYSSKRETVN